MKHFFVITNTTKDPDLSVTRSVMNYLASRSCSCEYGEVSRKNEGGGYFCLDPDQIPDDTDCFIVLGGDGTLIHAATDTIVRQIPLLGINLGTLGYLAEVDRQSVYPALDHLVRDEFQVERRMTLGGTIYHEGKPIDSEIALNDVVIRTAVPYGTIDVKNFVNNLYLNSYKADGIIISTPTGSTGYTLSVGGPIIAPSSNLFVMTPLAAHELNTRSIVLRDDDRISVLIGPGRDNEMENAAAYFDGGKGVSMTTGDRIDIYRGERGALLIRLNNDSFLERLSRKINNF